MKEKKNAVITFRTENWIKENLQRAAEDNGWSVAQTVEEVCKKFIANPQPDTITIKLKDLENLITEIKKDNWQAVKIKINLEADEEKMTLYKTLQIIGLESSGWGSCYDFETIKGMSREEILDIP